MCCAAQHIVLIGVCDIIKIINSDGLTIAEMRRSEQKNPPQEMTEIRRRDGGKRFPSGRRKRRLVGATT